MTKVNGTKTSAFGISKRENHDSSDFYNSKLYSTFHIDEKQKEIENEIDEKIINSIICADSRHLDFLPDSSIHLVVTSPPYNVSKEYDDDLSIDEYLQLLFDVFSEAHRVLICGGRVCINIANVGRKPYIPYHSFIIQLMTEIGFFMRGEIIWNKNGGAGASTAWGSWQSASNPTLRDTHEYILVFSKGKFGRHKGKKENTITKNEFIMSTKSIWDFSPEQATKVGHPAPFPIELPYRCIQLFTFKDEIVLDPFCGVGSSCVASIDSNRRYIGVDNNQEYVERAKKRINLKLDTLERFI